MLFLQHGLCLLLCLSLIFAKILNNKGICKEFDKELLILRVKSQFDWEYIYYVSNLKENSFTLSYLLYDEMIVENFVRVGKLHNKIKRLIGK